MPAALAVDYVEPFTDVPTGKFYAEPVSWAVDQEITTGMTKTTFAPDVNCTRAQIVTFLYRAEGKPTVSGVEKVGAANRQEQAALEKQNDTAVSAGNQLGGDFSEDRKFSKTEAGSSGSGGGGSGS